MREIEFRFNLAVWTMMNFLWFGLVFASVELIFGQVELIAGWDRKEVLLLVCITSLFFDFFHTFVMQNLKRFSRLIRHGELDLALLKPINLRFLVSTRYFEFDHYPRMIVLFFLIFKFLSDLSVNPSVFAWLNFGLLFALGIFIFYNLFFIFTTTNIWFMRLFNLGDLFSETISVSRYPLYIFKRSARLFFTYVIPVAFIATFPAQALLSRAGFGRVLLGSLIGLVMFFLSQKFWRFALRHYHSASS